jgi:hypothetical protein
VPAKKPAKPPAWADLGAPSITDSLAANAWMHQVLAVSAHKTITDGGIDERERRKELREIAAAMRGLIPQTRLLEAETVVRGEANAMNDARTGPELEDAAPIDRSSSKPTAKRGRPRKRSTL